MLECIRVSMSKKIIKFIYAEKNNSIDKFSASLSFGIENI